MESYTLKDNINRHPASSTLDMVRLEMDKTHRLYSFIVRLFSVRRSKFHAWHTKGMGCVYGVAKRVSIYLALYYSGDYWLLIYIVSMNS